MDKLKIKINRYPGKMVTFLAEHLVQRYSSDAKSLFDPYCGSSVILKAAKDYGIGRISGTDINPYAVLLSDIQLNGFYSKNAIRQFKQLKDIISSLQISLPITWNLKNYWFTQTTLRKYELLRGAANKLNLKKTKAGQAILLALALSVRPCSLADQISPKPFISKNAKKTRKGTHFDPIKKTEEILYILCEKFGKKQKQKTMILCEDFTKSECVKKLNNSFTHIITSPPYINAQDYFRNWKLELYILEDLLLFKINKIKNIFIGTETGDLLTNISNIEIEKHYKLVPQLKKLSKKNKRLASVVHRYLIDMNKSIININRLLIKHGKFILVCGDNLVGNIKFKTSDILKEIVLSNGFVLTDKFVDKIRSRQLPPKRYGHKGLIKEEIIFAFKKTVNYN